MIILTLLLNYNSHHFLGVTKDGQSAIVHTKGNPSCHVILRGSNSGPNYDHFSVGDTVTNLKKEKLNSNIMIDFSRKYYLTKYLLIIITIHF